MTSEQKILVSEIFGPTIQGEGAQIGKPTVFVRTGGCDYRCKWCDTLYAVKPEFKSNWQSLNSVEIFEKVEQLSNHRPLLITLSGGNPALQPLGKLIEIGQAKGYQFSMETQGSVSQSWFSRLDFLTLSPKPPSSNMPFDAKNLSLSIKQTGALPKVSLKFVIANKKDLIWAKSIADHYPNLACFLQPCNEDTTLSNAVEISNNTISQIKWIHGELIEMGWFNVSVLPQLHLLLWGNKAGV